MMMMMMMIIIIIIIWEYFKCTVTSFTHHTSEDFYVSQQQL